MKSWYSTGAWLLIGSGMAVAVAHSGMAGAGLADYLTNCAIVFLSLSGALAFFVVRSDRAPGASTALGAGLLVSGLGALAWLLRGAEIGSETGVQSAARVVVWSAGPAACSLLLLVRGRLGQGESGLLSAARVPALATPVCLAAMFIASAFSKGMTTSIASLSSPVAAVSLILLLSRAISATGSERQRGGATEELPGLLLCAAAQIVLIMPPSLAPQVASSAGVLVALGYLALALTGFARVRQASETLVQVAIAKPMLLAGVPLFAWFLCGMAQEAVYTGDGRGAAGVMEEVAVRAKISSAEHALTALVLDYLRTGAPGAERHFEARWRVTVEAVESEATAHFVEVHGCDPVADLHWLRGVSELAFALDAPQDTPAGDELARAIQEHSLSVASPMLDALAQAQVSELAAATAGHGHLLYYASAVVAVPIILLVGLSELRRRTQPLVVLADHAETIQQGGRQLVATSRSKDEIGTVIRMFNVLLDSLQEGETEILQSVNLTRDIIEGMPFGVIVSDLDGNIRRANGSILGLLGLDGEGRLLGGSVLGPECPPDYNLAPDLERWDSSVAHEETLVAADGAEIPVLRTVMPLQFGHEALILNAYISIADQKNALRDLQLAQGAVERNARERMAELTRVRDDLARLVETASAPIIGLDTAGRINEWNTMAAFVTGYFRDEAVGRDLVEMLMPAHMQASAREVFQATLDGDSTRSFECPVATQAGRVAHLLLNWTSRRDNRGAVVGVVIVGQDITERQAAEEQLARRERHQSAVAQFGYRALSAVDMNALVSEAADTVASALECEYSYVLEPLPDGVELAMRAGVGWDDGLKEGAVITREPGSLSAATLDSTEYVVYRDIAHEERFSLCPLLMAHGVVSGITVAINGQHGPYGLMGVHTQESREFTPDEVIFFRSLASALSAAVRRIQAESALDLRRENLEREVEERTRELRDSLRRLEDTNLLLQEANRHRSRFLASMSHELRTPLNGILGLAELLQGQFFGELNEQQLAYTVEIDRSGKRLLSLVNDLLDMAKTDASSTRLELVQCLPAEFIDPAVSTLSQRLAARGIVVSPLISPSVGFVEVDLAKCRQILLHVLTNAASASESNGVVAVTVGAWHEGCIRVSVHYMHGERKGSVGEDGDGEPSLSVTRRLVEQHGGEMGVDYAGETGTTVWFILPQGDALRSRHTLLGADSYALPEPRTVSGLVDVATQGPGVQTSSGPSPCEILVVEDDEGNALLMVDMLAVGGHNVRVARSGEEALILAEEQVPWLVFMDLGLSGINGFETARKMAETPGLQGVPMVALTGRSREDVAEECEAAGFRGILTKPVDLRALQAAVTQYAEVAEGS